MATLNESTSVTSIENLKDIFRLKLAPWRTHLYRIIVVDLRLCKAFRYGDASMLSFRLRKILKNSFFKFPNKSI